ncbi:pilus assembly PilX family protein [Desulfosediminicola flagellatus]|uniref:pilus assembly PilX family protein n=1 Tax=Desulfosediminicola flagellatus TaxID=2569541 RepID=UPI0010AB8F30|nr:pilus assembly PilX N-terminal domain-containing protein [Desulfosediminicola flagellatus]
MRNINSCTPVSQNNQDGFVLVLSLIMLAVLSVIGIAALNTTDVELQIAGNDKAEKVVFYGAESGCRRGGQWLRNLQMVIVDDYVDSDLMTDYLAAQNFNASMDVHDISTTEESNLGDANYAAKYIYGIKESEASPGTRLDCRPIPGSGPDFLVCLYDVSCTTTTSYGGSKAIDIRVAKPTHFN